MNSVNYENNKEGSNFYDIVFCYNFICQGLQSSFWPCDAVAYQTISDILSVDIIHNISQTQQQETLGFKIFLFQLGKVVVECSLEI